MKIVMTRKEIDQVFEKVPHITIKSDKDYAVFANMIAEELEEKTDLNIEIEIMSEFMREVKRAKEEGE